MNQTAARAFFAGFAALIALKLVWSYGGLGFVGFYDTPFIYGVTLLVVLLSLGRPAITVLRGCFHLRGPVVLLLLAAVVLWAVPVLYGLVVTDLAWQSLFSGLWTLLLVQIFCVGFTEELVFRELPHRISPSLAVILALSVPGFYAVQADLGAFRAVLLSFTGLVFLALRYRGVAIFPIAVVSGATAFFFTHILRLDLPFKAQIGYLLVYGAVMLILAGVIFGWRRRV